MSVVVAVKDKETNSVWVGCDSQASCGNLKRILTNKSNYKIFKPNKDDNLIIGVVGILRDANILYCVDNYIDELTMLKNEVDFKYVVTKIVPKLQSILKENKIISEKDGIIGDMNNQIILAYKDKIFEICNDFCVVEHDECSVIGSGFEFSLGSLSENKNISYKEQVINAIKASCKHDLYVNHPIILMNTMTDDTIIIN